MSDASSATSAIAATTASSSTSSSGDSGTKQAKVTKDMEDLAAAIKKHDTKAAQKALLQLALDSSAGSSVSSAGNGLISKLAKALNSGDMPTASKVFSSFETDAASASTSQTQSSSNSATPSMANATSTETDLFNGKSATSRFSVTV